MPLQHSVMLVQGWPGGRHFIFPASALFASPKQASAMPARPTPNFFSAARRVTDWAICLVSSSNLLFMCFLSYFGLLLSTVYCPSYAVICRGWGGSIPISLHGDR